MLHLLLQLAERAARRVVTADTGTATTRACVTAAQKAISACATAPLDELPQLTSLWLELFLTAAARTVTQDTQLGRHPLPAGTSLAYSPYLIHHRPDLYTDPDTFDPDRWDPRRPQPPRNAFISFATGARKCIGDTFAMAEATLALATITARWRLKHLPGHHRTRPVLEASIGPGELRMRPTPR
ncbi:cytochrome P450 [Streptomyces lydicus]|uniref:cytochrome P450 n=1 Tax=Streptomyces lydicus TaxID=47763 RepID=UPI0037A23502